MAFWNRSRETPGQAVNRVMQTGPATRSLTQDTVPWIGDTSYGVARVAPVSQDRALSLAPVYAAVSMIAGDISTLPVKAYRRTSDDRQPMSNLPQLFDRLVTSGEIVSWLHQCMASLLLRGNAYGLVTERDGFGFPIGIVWLDPARVTNNGQLGRTQWLFDGKPIPDGDIVHLTKFVVSGQVEGLSPIGAFAQTMGVGLYAQSYGHDYFANGGTPPGVFRNTAQPIPSQEQAAVVKARLGAAIRTREPLVVGSDWEFSSISVSPAEAQFLETIRATATNVASIYHVSPEDIGGDTGKSMTYATVELNQIKYVTRALRPWLALLESAFSALLPDRQYVKFNADALIRTDIKTRYEVYEISRKIGLRNTDELRALEDLPPLPDGAGQDYAPLGANFTPPGQPTSGGSPVPADSSNVVPIQKVNP